MNLGSAKLLFVFTVDEQGQILEEDMSVDQEQSEIDRPRHFPLFAQAAIKEIKNYRFVFEEASDGACERRQRVGLPVRFKFN